MKRAIHLPDASLADLRALEEEFGPLLKELGAADILAVSVSTIQNWRKVGGGPPYLKLGTAANAPVRYPLRYLQNYLREHLVEDPPPRSGSQNPQELEDDE